jgi:hypothetical protein
MIVASRGSRLRSRGANNAKVVRNPITCVLVLFFLPSFLCYHEALPCFESGCAVNRRYYPPVWKPITF